MYVIFPKGRVNLMENKCSNCGTVIPEGNAFCTECGTPASQAEEKPKKEKTPISDNVFHNEKDYVKPLHSVAYFFLILLFAIPVVGLISSIGMSASSKNENLANFGKAVFVWKMIFIVITVVALIVLLVFLHNKGITFEMIGLTYTEAFTSLVK